MSVYKIGMLLFEPDLRIIKYQDGKRAEVRLSDAESKIFETLIANPTVFFDKDELLRSGWNGRPVSHNSLPVAIANLRRTLNDSDVRIDNMPKKGYAAFISADILVINDEVKAKNEDYATMLQEGELLKVTPESALHSTQTQLLNSTLKGSVDMSASLLTVTSSKLIFFLKKINTRFSWFFYVFFMVTLLYWYLFMLKHWVSIDCDVSFNNVTVCYQHGSPPPKATIEQYAKGGLVLYSSTDVIHLGTDEDE